MKLPAPLLAGLLLAASAAPALAAPLPPSGTLDLAGVAPGSAVRWTGSEPGALAGGAVAGLGDFDGDGKRDVAVGEPKRDTAAGKDAGVVRILTSARSGGPLDAAITISGAGAGDYAGFDVAAAGDVNADGLADLLVGAPLAARDAEGGAPAGAAYLVLGRRGSGAIDLAGDFGGIRLTGAEPGSSLGRSVASLPDVNGDGRPELLLGAPTRDVGDRTDAGSAYVVFGTQAPSVDVSRLVEDGTGYRVDGPGGSPLGGALAGRALSSLGDLNGDDKPELLVTAPRAVTNGRPDGKAWVLWGRSTPGVIDLEAVGEQGYAVTAPTGEAQAPGTTLSRGTWLGESIAGLGDVNADGRPDLVVGQHLADGPDRPGAGLAHVVFGKATTSPVDLGRLGDGGYRITGVGPQDQTGFAVAPAGDVNADALPDVAISAPLADPLSRETAGAAYVVYGRSGEQSDVDLAEIGPRGIRIAGAAGDTLGFGLDGVGDVDGDGGDDLALGAVSIDQDYLFNVRSTSPGSAAIVFGASGKPSDTPGAEITSDPGYREEVARGCVPALNVQAVLEDNRYTDKEADPARIRLAGLQGYVGTPRNLSTVLGVSGFGDERASEPVLRPTELQATRLDTLKRTLFDAIKGEDSFPGYAAMFDTLADDNPAAGARIMVVDRYLFRDIADLPGLTDGSAPTYVVAIGDPPDRNRADIRQMQRVARETKGRYYEVRSARQLERTLLAIQSRIRCDVEADDFQANIDAGDEEAIAETELEEGVHTADVTVSWRDDEDDYEIEQVDVLDEDGDLVRRIDDEEVAASYSARGRSAPVLGGRGRTFRTLHIRRARAGTRLRVVVRSDGRRSSGRVYARITQSRRRR